MSKRQAPVRLKSTITAGAPAPTLATTPVQTQPAIRITAQAIFDDLPRSAFVREARLIPDVLPFSHATLWRKVKDKSMVQPKRLSARVTAFNVGEIRDWLQSQSQGVAA